MIEVKAPNLVPEGGTRVFLAGSIEMGTAKPWHKIVCDAFSKDDITFMNPRREEWDASWEQSIQNAKFKEQVDWELQHLDDSDLVFVYIDPDTKSPITLMEIGLHIKSKPMILVCPDGFWRKGNIEVTAARYGVTIYNTLEDGIAAMRTYLCFNKSSWNTSK